MNRKDRRTMRRHLERDIDELNIDAQKAWDNLKKQCNGNSEDSIKSVSEIMKKDLKEKKVYLH